MRNKSRNILYVLFILLVLTINVFGFEKSKVYNLVSDKEYFYIKMILKDKDFYVGKNNVLIEIYDKDYNPIDKAKIEILLWMNEHGHYSSANPKVEEIKPGVYDVKNLDFEMSGNWEIRIIISKGKIKDKASLEITIR